MNLKKFISGVSALTIAASAFAAMTVTANAAAHAITLTDSLTVSGYKAKAFYNFQSADVQAAYPVTSSKDTDARYRTDGYYGIFNYGGGTRTGTVSISVAAGDIVVVEHYQNQTYTGGVTVNGKSADENLTASAGYSTYAITADSETLAFGLARAEYVTGILIMEIDTDTPVDTLVVNYMYGDNVVFTDDTIDIAGKHVGDALTIPYRRYVSKDGTLYQAARTNNAFTKSVTASADTVVTIPVTAVTPAEGETFVAVADGDGDSSNNASVRASYGSAKRGTLEIADVQPGIYKLVYNMYLRKQGDGPELFLDDTSLGLIATGTSWTTDITTADVTVTTAGTLSIKNCDMMDTVVLYKTGEYVPPVTTTDAGFTFNSTVAKFAGSTVTLKIAASNGVETKEGAVDITDKLDGFDGELMLAVILTDVPEGVTIESATIEVE